MSPSPLTFALALVGGMSLCSSRVALAEDGSPDASTSTSAEGAVSRPSGLQLGARLAYGLPLGRLAEGTDLSSVDNGMSSLQIDAGWRFVRRLFVGVYGQYGSLMLAHDGALGGGCRRPDVDCTGRDWRLGVQAHWHFAPGRGFDPWVGVGVGTEIHALRADGPVAGNTYRGLEANAQIGGDYRLAPGVGLGPFLAFSLAEFGSCSSEDGPCALGPKAVHAWLFGGIRGVFDV